MFDKSVVELKNLVNKLNDFTCSCTQHSMETVRVEEEEDIDVIAVESRAVPVATGHEENKQGTTVAGGVRSEPGDGGGREDDDETDKAAEDRAAVTRHAENKHGPSVAGGARSTPEEGGEDEEEAFDHENVEEQISDSHCPLKYFHQAMKQSCDGKYQDTLILDS